MRVSHELKALCQKAAKLQGRTLTDFGVHSVAEAARRTVHESEFVEPSRRDRVALLEALLNPPAPNASLRVAMERHAEVVS